MTRVLAGALQVDPQLPSSLAFLLAGGQLSHVQVLCTVHCTPLYLVYCTLYMTLCTTVPCVLHTVQGGYSGWSGLPQVQGPARRRSGPAPCLHAHTLWLEAALPGKPPPRNQLVFVAEEKSDQKIIEDKKNSYMYPWSS